MIFVETFCAGPIETNAVLIGCLVTGQAAIIDSPAGSTSMIFKALEKKSLKLEMVLFTHSHWDHIADAALLKKQTQVPCYIHAEDAGNLENPGSDLLPLFFPIEGIKPDRFLVDGQVLRLGELAIKVIHTPGHTPGGVCFWLEKEKILISGDTLFRGTIGNLSLPTARPEKMRASLHRLSQLPPDTRVIPGHGEETTIGAEKRFGGLHGVDVPYR